MVDPRNPDEDETEDALLETDEGADAGQLDDEGGDDAQAGPESQEAQAQERVSRRDDRLREELRAEREHRARVEAELSIIRQEREQRQQAQLPREENDQEFAARIALLEPMDQMQAKLDRAIRNNNRQTALASFAAADRADKVAFDARAITDPTYKKYAQEVENILAVERRKGRDFDRETILNFIVGRERRTSVARNSQQQSGQRQAPRQQTRTTGGSGDVAREQRPRRFAAGDMSPEAVRQRLMADDAFI